MGRLPDDIGDVLLVVAQESFTQGLRATAATSALILIAVAIPATLKLRGAFLTRSNELQLEPEGEQR